MEEQSKRLPVNMEFTVDSITEGIEFWLNNVVLRPTIVVDKIMWDPRINKFSVTLANGIQVAKKL